MRIRWFGHACFEIVTGGGTRIVTDPFDETVGYAMPDVEADIVTSSHDHFDHNHAKAIKGSFQFIDSPGEYNIADVEIKGIPTFHDEMGGRKRGPNVVFVFRSDGISVCHCGDLGHEFDAGTLKGLSGIDILMIPVGGTYTVDASTAAKIVKSVNPRVVIPMHYKTKALAFPIKGVEPFLKLMGSDVTGTVKELEVDRESIGSLSQVVVMDYE